MAARRSALFLCALIGVVRIGSEMGPSARTTLQTDAVAEKDLLAAFKTGFGSPDSSARAAAVTALGEASRKLSDHGASKKVAQALVRGLEDEDLDVAQAACFQLGRERDVDTTVRALGEAVKRQVGEIAKRFGRADKESRDQVERGTVLLGNTARVLANYRDDRAAESLVGALASVSRKPAESELAGRLVRALAPPALELGTLSAVEAAVKRTRAFAPELPEEDDQCLRDALLETARRVGASLPDGDEATPAVWQAWLESSASLFPRKLGRLAEPPRDDPRLPIDGLPGKSG